MRARFSLLLSAVVLAALAAVPVRAADPAVIHLWSGKAPGEQDTVAPEQVTRSTTVADRIDRVTNVSDPTLTVYPAPSGKNSGVGVIIAPGGAYQFLSWSLEGDEVAKRFNEAGVTAFVLKYRVPTRAHDPGNRLALMDAQRSLGIVRSRAKEWGLDPAKLGFLGFSAGGNLAAKLETNYAERAYPVADDADRTSCKPDFAVLIYPGGITDGADRGRPGPEFKLTKETPPTFLAVAADDKNSADESARYFLALRELGIPAELHVYASGGHGFGLRSRAGAAATWPDRCVEWLRTMKFLG